MLCPATTPAAKATRAAPSLLIGFVFAASFLLLICQGMYFIKFLCVWPRLQVQKCSHVQFLVCAVVHPELQGNYHVVLHATHLAAQSHALLAEAVYGCLELERVHAHLVFDALACGFGVGTDQRVTERQALLAQKVVKICICLRKLSLTQSASSISYEHSTGTACM